MERQTGNPIQLITCSAESKTNVIYRLNKSSTFHMSNVNEVSLYDSNSSRSCPAIASTPSKVNALNEHGFLPPSSKQQYLGHQSIAAPAVSSENSAHNAKSLDSCDNKGAATPCCRIKEGADIAPEISRLFPRACTLCGTTKTPLWRTGPEGPKSLCNACGIRAKKNRQLQVLQVSGEQRRLGDPDSIPFASPVLSIRKAAKRKSAVSEGSSERGDHENLGINGRCCHARLKSSTSKLIIRTMERANDSNVYSSNSYLSTTVNIVEDRGSCPTSPATPSPAKQSPYHVHNFPLKCKAPQVHPVPITLQKGSIVFSKDDEQAAFLLMALSCGLVRA